MYVASEHIQRWLHAGQAKIVPVEISSQIGEYLDNLPWRHGGSGLDWTRINGNQIALPDLTGLQQSNWLRTTLMRDDPFLVLWYVADQPCIACETGFAISNIDQAFWKAPGKRYLFGASYRDGLIEPAMSHFAEYDGADSLTAAK